MDDRVPDQDSGRLVGGCSPGGWRNELEGPQRPVLVPSILIRTGNTPARRFKGSLRHALQCVGGELPRLSAGDGIQAIDFLLRFCLSSSQRVAAMGTEHCASVCMPLNVV